AAILLNSNGRVLCCSAWATGSSCGDWRKWRTAFSQVLRNLVRYVSQRTRAQGRHRKPSRYDASAKQRRRRMGGRTHRPAVMLMMVSSRGHSTHILLRPWGSNPYEFRVYRAGGTGIEPATCGFGDPI